MLVRKYRPGEAAELWRLFHDTIHHVAARDYTPTQLQAWAPDEIDANRWRAKIEQVNPYVCEADGEIVGYADSQSSGLIDHFYVRHRWQRVGVGQRLFDTIEAEADRQGILELRAEVSITARPFFLAQGFQVIEAQDVAIGDVVLRNFKMAKSR